jgi:hypothetical protein
MLHKRVGTTHNVVNMYGNIENSTGESNEPTN